MAGIPFHHEQLQFIFDLAQHRLEFLDPFFRFLNYFDTAYFFFALIPIIWLGYSYKWGLRIFYWLMISNLINSYVKYLVGWPRPSTDLPEVGMYHFPTNGFPSGAAQTCMFLGGLLIYYWRTPFAWTIGTLYILLISFSRLYLGVHYPIDLVGGWSIAFILLFLFIKLEKPIEKWLIKKGLAFSLILSIVIPLALIFFSKNPSLSSMIGVGIGTYFSLKHHLFLPKPQNLNEGIGRSFIGLALLFLFVFLLPDNPVQAFSAGLFMSLVASPICRWCVDRKIGAD